MYVSDVVRREIVARFADADIDAVQRLLEAVDLGDGRDAAGLDRIQLAVLKMAAGDFERFARCLALAVTDWRDLLVGAGLGNEDWPEVLKRAGFRVP